MTAQPTLPGIEPTGAVPRRNASRLAREQRDAAQRLARAERIATFPEATRSPTSTSRDRRWRIEGHGEHDWVREASVTAESVTTIDRAWHSAWAHHVVARVPGRRGNRFVWRLVVFERRIVR